MLSNDRLLKLFQSMDVDGTGAIDTQNPRLSTKMRRRFRESVVKEILAEINSEQITFPQFERFIRQKEKELFEIFNELDRDHSGFLESEDLRLAMKKAGKFYCTDL